MQLLFEFLINLHPDLLVAITISVIFTLEIFFSDNTSFFKKGVHLLNSAMLQIGYFLVNLLLATGVVSCFTWAASNHIGLFNMIAIPYYLKVIAGIFLIDMVNYWAHRLYHTLEIFWRLHRVHHSDTALDSSTAYRFHPLDALLDNGAGILSVVVFGLDASIFILWFILYIPILVSHHANFVMPPWFDNTFGRIIVSPNYHKIHHHQLQEYTDSNYGQIFIIWDKLFGTFKTLPVSEIKFGLKEFEEPGQQSFWFLLISPFLKLRK